MIRPMLGKEVDLNKLKFPVMISPKMDGIRALIIDGVVTSRTGKPIRNKFVQDIFGRNEYNGFDGELIVGEPINADVYQKTVSGVMSEDGTPNVFYHVFDLFNLPNTMFNGRNKKLNNIFLEGIYNDRIKLVHQSYVKTLPDLLATEQYYLECGYEGIMIRNPYSLYKNGRSTLKTGELLKLKRFKDSEAIIIGILPKFHNTNEAIRNALGHTTRSSAMSGMIAEPLMGALSVKDIHTGVEFEVGSGFTEKQRVLFWDNFDSYKNKIIKYKYFPIGEKDKPRFPIFLGFRDEDDI